MKRVETQPICPSCNQPHPERVENCPLCDRTWKQAALGELGVWDGLAIRSEDDPERNQYAAYVACGCGFAGPSRSTCAGSIIAWNNNVALVRERLRASFLIEFKEAA